MRFKYGHWLALPMITLLSCTSLITDQANDQEYRYFPDYIGATWTYQEFYNSTTPIDTLTISIVGDTTIQIGPEKIPATIWHYRWRNKRCTGDVRCAYEEYVIVDKESATLYGCPDTSCLRRSLLFPFAVGQHWSMNPGWDSSAVVGCESLVVPAGTFKESWHVEEHALGIDCVAAGIDCILVQNFWYQPGIGLVKYEASSSFYPESAIKRELIAYDLP